jgi:hypothetical protein
LGDLAVLIFACLIDVAWYLQRLDVSSTWWPAQHCSYLPSPHLAYRRNNNLTPYPMITAACLHTHPQHSTKQHRGNLNPTRKEKQRKEKCGFEKAT